jgi:hypothetical protein
MLVGDIEIMGWLHSMDIYDYDICDGVVHVVGDVDINSYMLASIPVQFGYVSGDFYCSDNKLDSLYGCPSEVGGDFSCSSNKLTSLEGGPSEVGGEFYCSHNKLDSLEGCPSEVGGDFLCGHNNLTSLYGCPTEVGGGFYCRGNHFNVSPNVSHITIGGYFRWE